MTEGTRNQQSGLGRLCAEDRADGAIAARRLNDIERIEARFQGAFYAPHRHDTYAIGCTVAGVQTFRYRGEGRNSLPGQVIVLHPDEVHDGAAGTEEHLHYKMVYLEPAAVRAALGEFSFSLPFVKTPVVDDTELALAVAEAFDEGDGDSACLRASDVVSVIANGLLRHAGGRESLGPVAVERVRQAHDFLIDNASDKVDSADLEQVTGMDRFAVARQFRKVYGTSPHRFLMMRRLGRAKQMIAGGSPIAETAVATGFSDQSHLNRVFKRAYGVPPGIWREAFCGAQ